MKPILWGIGLCAVVGLVLAGWFCLYGRSGPAPLPPVAWERQTSGLSAEGDATPLLREGEAGRTTALQRAGDNVESLARSSTSRSGPGSWTLRVACEDEIGTPVGGCRVEARDSEASEILAHALTDAAGYASLQILAVTEPLVLRAEVEGQASSGERTIHDWERGTLDLHQDGVVRLVLYPFLSLRGTVKLESGSAVPGAMVSVRPKGAVIGGSNPSLVEPVLTDGRGAFTIQVDGIPSRVVVEASYEDLRTSPKPLSLPEEASQTLELVFLESDYQISGAVRTSQGCSVGGTLVVLIPVDPDQRILTRKVSPQGTFTFRLKEPGEYRLAARSASCLTFAPVAVTTTLTRRLAVADLLLDGSAQVSGRILWSSGEPLEGIPVGAHPVSSEADDGWLLESCFQELARVELTHTDTEGAFRLEGLHDEYVYELVCVPDVNRPECWVREAPVLPGTTDIVIAVDEARIRGGVLAGTAVRGSKREPVHEFSFTMHERYPGRSNWVCREGHPNIMDGEFRLEGLVIGNEYFVEARTADSARVCVGPWTATEEEKRVDLVFGMDGELKTRVHFTDGEAARDWAVSLVEIGDGPRREVLSRPQGDDGVVRFLLVAAGLYRVTAERGDTVVGPFDVEIVAGRMTELEINVGPR